MAEVPVLDPEPGVPPYEATGPAPSDPRGLGRLAFALAVSALCAYAVGIALLLVPVRTPQVQDCGAPGAFLLDGRVDVVPDAEDRILDGDGAVVHLPASVADEARDRPCRERVAARAVPATALMAAATVVGLAAFGLELFLVRPRRRRARAGVRPETVVAKGPPALPESHPQD